jgi:hypothetical protein
LSLNPGLYGRDIRGAFATDQYHVLLVANKFPTGFDQPLLCGMYVDKRLAGIQAVQTLSRGRDREGVDLSKVTLTHHALKNHGQRDLALGGGADEEDVTLTPMTETGSGEVREKEG